ncbi:sensor histidine kinase [Paramagnetospirillum magneticum]|uniref:histidine kinase n=1 Tax=Paramagnetospirillum magneticum (strain ATCC 700264 / AMB-1) TaxID=342108 RepID=Q2WAY3_PARM1|nr:sensor histidine kinase [Paramagnetospirillum magneticum]BAE48992.1 Signal transduction histidine kinase [Paramagnetospirillum magneticum AMB-1]
MASRDSLRRRLILGAGAWVLLALGVGGGVLGHAFADSAEQAFHRRLDTHLRTLLAVVDLAEGGTVTVGRPAGEPRFEQPYSGWYWQVSDGAALQMRSRSLWDAALTIAPDSQPGAVQTRGEDGPRGQKLEVLERDLVLGDNGRRLHVAVAADRAEVEEEIRRFRLLLALSLGGLGLGLLVAVAVQVGYGLKPLGRLEAELGQLTRGGTRLGGGYPREIAPLVAAMNRVLDHDENLIRHARNHLGNLAHALKTPLAVLRAECGTLPGVAPQIERVTRLIDLHLARAGSEASSARGMGRQTALAPLLADLAGAMRKVHADRRLEIAIQCPPDALFAAEADDLAEMVGNLMDNACKWAKTRVRVCAGPGSVRVEDDGPGLSPEQAEAAARRGIRLDESVPGSGLGLAIVADLATLSGLALDFGRSEWGGLAVHLSDTSTAG